MRLARWAVLCMALVALACVPAFAQDEGEGRDGNVIIVDCSQVQQVVASEGQYGDANAVAVNDSEAVAQISQRLDISRSQVNACLGNIGGADEETTDEGTTDEGTTDEGTTDEETTADEETTEETMVRDGETIIMPDELGATALPDTGGPGGYGLAAGCALLGVGLIINRIVR
jgi:hypothetical protein